MDVSKPPPCGPGRPPSTGKCRGLTKGVQLSNMRFRAGLVIGFGLGFYAGAMAGRGAYEQINRSLRRAKRSDTFDAATDKAKAVVDLGVERARDIVETKLGREAGKT